MKSLKSIPKDKLQKLVLVAIVSLIALGVIGNFYIRDNFTKLSVQRERAQKLKVEIDQAQSSLKSEATNTNIRDQMKAFVDEERQRMVTGDPFSWVVREITLVAEKHPIRISGMRPNAKFNNLTRSRYEMFVARIEADGTYDQAGAFIRDLENTFPTGEIRAFELTVTDAALAQCRISCDFAMLMRPEDSKPSVAERKPKS